MARQGGPIVVCTINLKGGVGKSTISTLLARYAFNSRGLDVLAVDVDPQANLSQALLHSSYTSFLRNQEPSIVEVFRGYAPPGNQNAAPRPRARPYARTVNRSGGRSLDLVASRFDFSDTLVNAVAIDQTRLASLIADEYQDKDFVIIDCSPSESVFTFAAYHASRYVLVPVKPEYFATIGFPLLQQSLSSFRARNRGQRIDVCGVVINNAFYDGGNDGGPEKLRAMSDIENEAASNGWPIYENEIPHSRGFPKQMRGDYSYPGNSEDFRFFAAEFFDDLGL